MRRAQISITGHDQLHMRATTLSMAHLAFSMAAATIRVVDIASGHFPAPNLAVAEVSSCTMPHKGKALPSESKERMQ